ncbi:MAG: site-specific DNA-methyltransferase [Thermodesulfobacteriota bacterium]
MNDLIVAKVNQARNILAECTMAEQAKRVKDMAAAVEIYAKRQKLGKESIDYAHMVVVDAMTLLGEFLERAPKNVGAKGSIVTGRTRRPVRDTTPTMAEVGLTKYESSEAQLLSKVAKERPEDHEAIRKGEKTVHETKKEMKKEEKEERRKAAIEEGKKLKEETVFHLSIEQIQLAPNSIDLMITDPPYDDKHIQHYSMAAKLAQSSLKPGRFFCCYAGKLRLPEVINAITPHLEWIWEVCAFHSFSKEKHLGPPYQFAENWRPVLIFKKAGKAPMCNFQQDVVRAERDKTFHDWQQDLKTPLQLIEAYTEPGEIVVDPFCGGGTTLVAAKQLGRRWLGFDISEESVALSKQRLYGIN